jgi:hypothetical protein
VKWTTSTPRKPKEQNENVRIVKSLAEAEKEEAARGRRIVACEPYRIAWWRIFTATAIGAQSESTQPEECLF